MDNKQNKRKNIELKLLVIVTFAGMVFVNALANILPINGINTGDVSDSYPNLFAPAGLTFSIWGVIYFLLALHVLYQLGLLRGRNTIINGGALMKDNDAFEKKEGVLNKTAVLFSISSLVNTAWIFSWHYKIISLSMLLMICLLICLILIVSTLKSESYTLREKLFVRLPFSIYFGWITVATIANATVLLVYLGWTGLGLTESTWAVIMLAIGALLGIITTIRNKDIAYVLVFIWAYLGILIKHIAATGFSGQYTEVIITVVISIVLFIATIIFTARSGRRHPFIG